MKQFRDAQNFNFFVALVIAAPHFSLKFVEKNKLAFKGVYDISA